MCLGGRALLCNSGLAAILRLDKRVDHARFRRGNNNILFLNYTLTVISLSPADNREKYCRIAAMSAQSGPPQERHGLNASRTRVNARKMTLIKFTSPPVVPQDTPRRNRPRGFQPWNIYHHVLRTRGTLFGTIRLYTEMSVANLPRRVYHSDRHQLIKYRRRVRL